MKASLVFKCREGWSYLSWQRVEVWLRLELTAAKLDYNVTADVYQQIGEFPEFPPITDQPVLSSNGQAFFVLSGESFNMVDFVDVVSELVDSLPIIIEDGDEPPEPYPYGKKKGGRQ
jgi:hypothetical protein